MGVGREGRGPTITWPVIKASLCLSPANPVLLGALESGPGWVSQTLLIQPEATKSLMQEKIRFLVPVTLIESGFLNHIVAVTPV